MNIHTLVKLVHEVERQFVQGSRECWQMRTLVVKDEGIKLRDRLLLKPFPYKTHSI